MIRYHTLDYLRGAAAIGIMIYHYFTWSFGNYNAEDFLGKVGIYGVSIFYILSGLTLRAVYFSETFEKKSALVKFYLKRFYRIYPLLWIATLLTIVISLKAPNPIKLLLNLTGLFGFVSWDSYFATGLWSIGNELVFYSIFPFYVVLSARNKRFIPLIFLFSLSLFFYFTFGLLNNSHTLQSQWHIYTHPLNQLFFFIAGMVIYDFPYKPKLNSIGSSLLISGILILFYLYPVSGGKINLITGINRLVYSSLSIMLTYIVFHSHFHLKKVTHRVLLFFGSISYSLYLLHPIVFKVITNTTQLVPFELSQFVVLSLSIITTIASSYFVYMYVEKYFIKRGKLFILNLLND